MRAPETMAERLADLERRVAALERLNKPTAAVTVQPTGRPMSPREFLLSRSGARLLNDKALVAGYFIETLDGKESFAHDDLGHFLNASKETLPKNRRDITCVNVKRGTFREVGERVQASIAKNRWSLTNKGIAMVEANFAEKYA